MPPSDTSDSPENTQTPDLQADDLSVAGEIASPPCAVADPVPALVKPVAAVDKRKGPVSRGPLWKTFLAFLAPMLLSNILQSLSGTLNNVYVGQMIGVGALAAVSSFFPVMFFFIAFTIGLGAGA
ncbi:MAG: MATE family efflux transporter, partial [Polaromonas sp.]|nr:MATE family efflux transporter [Polaromonas sp.]